MKIKLAAVLAVAALALLAACGPTGSAPAPGMAPASHSACPDADGAQGDPDGDCAH